MNGERTGISFAQQFLFKASVEHRLFILLDSIAKLFFDKQCLTSLLDLTNQSPLCGYLPKGVFPGVGLYNRDFIYEMHVYMARPTCHIHRPTLYGFQTYTYKPKRKKSDCAESLTLIGPIGESRNPSSRNDFIFDGRAGEARSITTLKPQINRKEEMAQW